MGMITASSSPVHEIAKLLSVAIWRRVQKQLDLPENGSMYPPSEQEET